MIKKIQQTFYLILIFFLALLAGTLVLSNFNTPLNYRVFNVMSGSMEPAVKIGSIVFVRPHTTYKENDIVTFQQKTGGQLTTHRIVGVANDTAEKNTLYKTKGDTNEDIDQKRVDHSQILGKVVLSVPYIGYPLALVKTRIGFFALIVFPALLIIISELRNIYKEGCIMIKERKIKRWMNQ